MKINIILLALVCVAASLQAGTVTVDSLAIDSVWNSDSASRVSRDCRIRYKLVCSELAWCRISVTLDSGATWIDSNPLKVLDSALAQGPAVSGWKQAKVRVLGSDRTGVAFKVTANQLNMIGIPGGTFQMGTTTPGIAATPVHAVTLTPFTMSATPITQGIYHAVIEKKANSTAYANDSLGTKPADVINWFNTVLYCNATSKTCGFDTVYTYTGLTWLSSGWGPVCLGIDSLKVDMGKNGYRLPTEAEFEYACRAGTTTDYYWGKSYPMKTHDDSLQLDSNAVWGGNSGVDFRAPNPFPVGSKKPNGWGLYDMAGLIWQWCQDWSAAYTAGPQTDPVGPDTTDVSWAGYKGKVLRNGSYNYGDANLASGGRFATDILHQAYNVGFRVVRRP